MAEAMETHRSVIDWQSQSDAGLRLRCGELTAQEIRTVRAVLNAIVETKQTMNKPQDPEGLKHCPFCGLTDQDTISPDMCETPAVAMHSYPGGYRIECEGCGCKGPWHHDQQAALDAWGSRHNAKSESAARHGSASWQSPETAPRDGTLILGDFGWPWPNVAVWDEYDGQWCIATLQAGPMVDGPTNSWIETDTERRDSLRRWMEMPTLLNA
jgi:Lar family restriction alleviation protein